jgi:hypothetical protein
MKTSNTKQDNLLRIGGISAMIGVKLKAPYFK